jgi:ParB/RepB/Spo0J family partition protein
MSDVPFPDQVSGVGPLDGGTLDGTVRPPRLPAAGRSQPVDISRLHPHPDNIREDLGDLEDMAASIRMHGILQALVVVPHPSRAGHYHVLAGHRRLAAARLAGLADVPVTVRQADIGVSKAVQVMLIENCQREDLGPVEKAEAMGKLVSAGISRVAIAKAIGMSDATVSTYLALLELDRATQRRVAAGMVPVMDAVRAVRKTRAASRSRAGQADRNKAMALTWEPDYFTDRHPLARKARAMCDAREHNARRRLGRVACGECWETVIRRDEQLVAWAGMLEGDL